MSMIFVAPLRGPARGPAPTRCGVRAIRCALRAALPGVHFYRLDLFSKYTPVAAVLGLVLRQVVERPLRRDIGVVEAAHAPVVGQIHWAQSIQHMAARHVE